MRPELINKIYIEGLSGGIVNLFRDEEKWDQN